MERRLAAIVAADVVGYSRMIRADEDGTIAALRALRAELIDPAIAKHRGRIVKLMGDGVLVEYASVVDAVASAVEVQEGVAARNVDIAEDKRIVFRIGVNLGDVVIDGEDIQGDGVNLAARLEALAEPGAVCVADAVHEQVRDRLGLVFTDLGEKQVKNIDRPVRAWQWREKAAAAPNAKPAPSLSAKPSIAVLPFANLSRDAEQDYFSNGVADDIITDLARYAELRVIARQSSFAYAGKGLGAREIADDLGVQYIVDGSVRRAGDRVRVSVQLIDAATGAHVWTERYDRDLADIFAVQDEITAVIVNTLAGQIARRHYRRSMSRAPDATDAYDHALRAMEMNWRMDPHANLTVREEAEKAIAIDPQFARAHALIAWTHVTEGSNRWGDDPARSLQRAFEAAAVAVAADDREPWAHAALGFSDIWCNRAFDRGLAALRRAIELNPSSAHFRSMLAAMLGYAGRPEESLREIELAMRLNPHYPVLYLIFLGRALFNLRRFEEALPHLERVAAAMPGHSNALALAAACYAALGRTREAKAVMRQVLAASGDYTLNNLRRLLPYADPDELAFYLDMLRRAGMPKDAPDEG